MIGLIVSSANLYAGRITFFNVVPSNASFAIVVTLGRLIVSKLAKLLKVAAGIVVFSVNVIDFAFVKLTNVVNSSAVNSTLEMIFSNSVGSHGALFHITLPFSLKI